MKITALERTTNPEDQLLVCCDVSKATLNLYAEHRRGDHPFSLEDEFPNRTGAIERVLLRCRTLAKEAGLEEVTVLCESSGGLERKLLLTARRLGFQTKLINPEHVSKLKVVESNDAGKTDHKDPRVMHMIARMGKTRVDRQVPERYRRIRRLTDYYDDEEDFVTATRTRIHALIRELFPDYDKKARFTFDTTGAALLKAYGFNPYRIARAGYTRFQRKMKNYTKYVRFETLKELFTAAEQSARYRRSEAEVALMERRLSELWRDYEEHTARQQELRRQIEDLGEELQQSGAVPRLDQLVGVSLFNLTRVVGQSGPLTDFHSKRVLLRYAGLNLYERSSGTYKGQTRISKKGRVMLRKMLARAVYPITQRKYLYGAYYRRKREEGMPAIKARVAVMRKFLGLLYALVRGGEAFDPERFATCESQYLKAA